MNTYKNFRVGIGIHFKKDNYRISIDEISL
ncbi:hypothetical protein M2326_000652 [Flavobacterium sp. 7A]|nr:hypothetical protein [Flavobacterium sp. 7A]